MSERRLRPHTMYLHAHALERLRLLHPDLELADALRLLHASLELDAAWVAVLTCRPLERVRDRYLLSPDGLGLFVVKRNRDTASRHPWVALTWLRFGPRQQEYALQLLEAA